MSMTPEEAIELVCYGDWINILMLHLGDDDINRLAEAMCIIGNALRPVTREQVEQMRGEWIIEDAGDGDRRKKCSLCNQPISGWWGRDRFCANCGSPMTDEAVDMVMERLEALHSETKTD